MPDETQAPSIAAHLGTAADAVRVAIHALTPGDEPVPVSDEAIAELILVAQRLPHLLTQLAIGIGKRAELGGLRLDYHGSQRYPDELTAINDAQQALVIAATAAAELDGRLRVVREITATIADTGDESDDDLCVHCGESVWDHPTDWCRCLTCGASHDHDCVC